MRRLTRTGQSTAEYAIVIALIIGTMIAMQTYVKRGIQGRVKDGVDSLVNASDHNVDFGSGTIDYSYNDGKAGQWEHDQLWSQVTTEVFTGTKETETALTGEDGKVARETTTIQQQDTQQEHSYRNIPTSGPVSKSNRREERER